MSRINDVCKYLSFRHVRFPANHADAPFPEQPEVYKLTLGGRATLYFFSRHAGMLEVWMEAGQLINRKAADILLRLLKLNQAGDDGPLLCACMDEHTDQAYLRTQVRLAECTGGTLSMLVKRLRARAAAMGRIIEGKNLASRTDSPPAISGSSFARLRLRLP